MLHGFFCKTTILRCLSVPPDAQVQLGLPQVSVSQTHDGRLLARDLHRVYLGRPNRDPVLAVRLTEIRHQQQRQENPGLHRSTGYQLNHVIIEKSTRFNGGLQ